MKKSSHLLWIGLIIANAILWIAFAAGKPATADSNPTEPTNNPAEQRAAMIRELTAIKTLLKQQNELFQGGLDGLPESE